MRPAVRFLLASAASALSALALLTITMPLYALLGGEGGGLGGSFASMALGLVAMFPFIVLIGGPITLPLAALAGGALLFWEKRRGAALSPALWAIVGLVAGILASLLLGVDDEPRARVASAIWFGSSGALAAWVFQKVMRRTTRPNPH